jgi:hypothetical protein
MDITLVVITVATMEAPLSHLWILPFSKMQTLINQKVIEAPGVRKPWWRFW